VAGPTGPTGPATALYNANATDVVANATDTYLTGSALTVSGFIKVGSTLRWSLMASKTVAGTAVPTYNIRFGAGGTLTDTARITTTGVAQTAATDFARIDIVAVVRALGATTVVAGGHCLQHSNGVIGFKNDEGNNIASATSAAFDSTPGSTQAGISINPGAAGVWTFQVVSACLENTA